jgi:anti-sigma regulatory factor (Ser/Thr protein kinase)
MPSTPFDASLTVPAQFDQLQRIASFIRAQVEQTGFSGLDINRIELAVDEACSNIIQHAYAGRSDGLIRVNVHVVPSGRITITLIDTGRSFDPDSIPEPDPTGSLDELKVGGLGLYLMRQAMDDVRFEFDVLGHGHGEPQRFNRLTMVKAI